MLGAGVASAQTYVPDVGGNDGDVCRGGQLWFEKAGTWKVETTAPGTVVFDNLLAIRP